MNSVLRIQCIIVFLLASMVCRAQGNYFSDEEVAWIKKHSIIEHGYEPNWPPYEIYSDDTYTGIVGDYLSIIERETGIDFVPIKNISWAESIKGLESGEIKFVPSCAITPERSEFLEFTSVIVSDPLVIVTARDGDFIGNLNYLEKKKVALPKNYYTIELIAEQHPSIIIVEKETILDCLNAVSTGECEAFIGSLGVVSYYINYNGYTNLKIAAPTKLEDVKIAMACTKDWSILSGILQKTLDRIPQEEQNEIRQRWISVRYEYGISSGDLWNYILLGLALIVLIIGFFIYWNRKLRKEINKRREVETRLSQSFVEISEQSQERKILLQEIHHRVKNNLQIVSSMIKLQAYQSDENNEPFDYGRTIDRINAISLIHDMIYKSENVNVENVESYLSALLQEIITAHSSTEKVSFTITNNDVYIDLKTLVPIAIILNELVVNSLKHAFDEDEHGILSITVNKRDDRTILIGYCDNGTWKKGPLTNGFGSSLIDIFTEQLDGNYTLDTTSGACYKFEFKLQFFEDKGHP
ncbi:MAG: two-component sensor histidine kinase/ABC-type amino acid transport substrate-binding protein [Crocinitomicaceae bacterium]|jgi:two-component sensor histidine kinase/ABC-type amino acid transport substrate-binding protein